MQDNPLGRATVYSDEYDAGLLYAVPRVDGRAKLGLSTPLPFQGVDLWTAYELSWLDSTGRPAVAVMSLAVPARSPQLIESKSLKLYLNSFAMTRFESRQDVISRLAADLAHACGSTVNVSVDTADAAITGISPLPGLCIDNECATFTDYRLNPSLLQAGHEETAETLHSHVLRSLCPVTGQPDTGSVLIEYRGPRIDRTRLLRYLVSFRQHADFHELCVERIFCDLMKYCSCRELTVYARYNRRGGIDINPFRSNVKAEPPPLRLWRQ